MTCHPGTRDAAGPKEGSIPLPDLTGLPPYAFAVALGFGFLLIAFAFAGRHRPPMALAGAIETLHAPASILFDEVYWQPVRLGGLSVGIEDILLCFSLGAGVWFAAVLTLGDRIAYRADRATAGLRLLVLLLVPVLAGLLTRDAGLTTMERLLAVSAGTAAILAALRPDLLALTARAVPIYTAYYIAFCYLCALLVPGFFAMWSGPELWGIRLAGLPVDEIAFVLVFSAGFPLVIGFVLDVRIAPGGGGGEADAGGGP